MVPPATVVAEVAPAERGRSSRRRGLAAWSAFVAITAITASAVLLEALDGRHPAWEVAVVVLLTLISSTVGLLIALRRPGNLIGWLLLANGLVLALDSLVSPYAYYGLIAHPGSLPGARWAALWDYADWPTLFAGVTAVALVFPNGRLPTRGWRRVAIASAVAFVGLTLAVLLDSQPLNEPFQSVSRPLPTLPSWAGTISLLFMVGTIASLFAAAWAVRVRFRRAVGVERLQLLWFAYAALGIPLTLLVCIADGLITGGVGAPTLIALLITLLAIPISVGIAVLRYRLFDIELVINRTLVYGTLTVCIVVAYVAIVAGLDALVHREGLAGLIAAGLVAAAVQPLRLRLQARVDHLVYGDRSDPYAALTRLGERLQVTLAPGEVAQTIVDSVAEALRLPYVAVEFEREGTVEVVAAHGRSGRGEIERLELTYQGETVGRLVALVPPGRELTSADRRLLGDLGKHSGPAVRAVRLTADLQRSRERLVTAREEERRRLRRDLHDGLGPVLAGMVLKLDAARNQLGDGSEAAAEGTLSELRDETQEAISDIRRLVYELRPPALDELGLVGALREQAARLGVGDRDRALEVSVTAPDELPTLPAAVEVAAYRIATEALTNVARHAAAHHCRVRVELNGELQVEVADDGRGLNGERPGVGLTSMRERAAELGGSCTFAPGPGGGTLVSARLPLAPA
jgi:two-component system, NarL family, sensor kinase